ncbi:sigma-70 family RNA polymerase sigma factor [Sphingomonas sp. ID1715]|uniref:sigma-70 family RNA polymerase sigma factor n=1 Tax=Sphingomonas sp. ID1715 TaxID=1656898 RepID=UPI001489193A|nr:sigma-70 family RNA polymerase sigma factor [Sphingomonas sp. ID1715]NNM77999.1 sigma-70 family RNA polymerase sigma factor [Sphingomonas sp. ID1715]
MLDDLSDEERMERVRVAVDRLPARRRNIFLLCRVENWSFEEIAEAYGISVGRVRKEIARALHDVTQEVFHGRRRPWWRRWF